ncbi:Maf family protein [Jannaschia sp. R86511]|uniref:Maf family protein n=1 Tax=Jannaschia sp. R86511 TaxID=3093853 RepID=UPI0036D41BEF
MSPAPALLLASRSPARLTTLRSAGVRPQVRVSEVDEDAVVAAYGVSDPSEVALLLARAKAEDVARHVEDVLVLGCDSVLDLDGVAHGRPRDAADAVERWRAMRGRSGVLRTGHWLVDTRTAGNGGTGASVGELSSTGVRFADLDDHEVAAYVATGEPLQVAGAFTLDGLGGAFVEGVEGDPHAVVGVGLPTLRRLLGQVGVRWSDLWQVADQD